MSRPAVSIPEFLALERRGVVGASVGEALRSAAGAARSSIESLRGEIESERSELLSIEPLLSQLQGRLQGLRGERDTLRQLVGRLRAELEDLRSRIQDARNRLSGYTPPSLRGLMDQLNALLAERDRLSQEIARVRAEIDSLRARITLPPPPPPPISLPPTLPDITIPPVVDPGAAQQIAQTVSQQIENVRREMAALQESMLRSRTREEASIYEMQLGALRDYLSRLENTMSQMLMLAATPPQPPAPSPEVSQLLSELARIRSEESRSRDMMQMLFLQLLSQRDSTSARALQDEVERLRRQVDPLVAERTELERRLREAEARPPPP
ncbi:MAG: hypothetical protein QXX57_00260, partial [Nitrososphaerota archaeon]